MVKETIGMAGAGAFLGYLLVDQNVQVVTDQISDPLVASAVGAVLVVAVGMFMMEDYELMD